MAGAKQQVGIVSPTHLWCHREILRGLSAYAHAKASWQIHFLSAWDNLTEFFQDRRPDGVILGDGREIRTLVDNNLIASKTVSVCANYFPPGTEDVARIDINNEEIGRVVAQYLLERQYQHFAYIGYEDDLHSSGRGHGFAQRLAEAGHDLQMLGLHSEPVGIDRGWTHHYHRNHVGPFLKSLPKPLGVLAFNDIRGREVVDTCKFEGLSVPEDVAVLGVDNDPLDCDLAYPALSSVNLPWYRIGYQAAEMLDLMMEGRPVESEVLMPPDRIVERQSTNSVAVSDADVAAALLYIREHAHLPFSVDHVVEHTLTGRRTLEKRFRAQMGRSLLDEINRVRLDRAKQLLAQTDLSVAEVAQRCGFAHVNWFCTCFQKAVRMSPGKFRSRWQF